MADSSELLKVGNSAKALTSLDSQKLVSPDSSSPPPLIGARIVSSAPLPVSLKPMPLVTSTMRAWVSRSPGLPPQSLRFEGSLSLPPLEPSQLRIKISHCSLSPGSVIMSSLFPAFLHNYPAIPELDFAGQIIELGTFSSPSSSLTTITNSGVGTREFKLDDYVFGSITVGQNLAGIGALAQYVSVESSQLAHIPLVKKEFMPSFTDQLASAAALPVSGCTALALLKAAQLKEGMKVVINGASGGVGTLVLQMAKHAVGPNGHVLAVCSSRNEQIVRNLGADDVVAYDSGPMPVCFYIMQFYNGKMAGRQLQTPLDDGFADCIIDAVGKQEVWNNCHQFSNHRAAYVTVGPSIEAWTKWQLGKSVWRMASNSLKPSILGGGKRRYVQVASTVNEAGLEELRRMVEGGSLRGVVQRVYDWDEEGIKEAYEIMLSHRARGKLIMKINE